ncbi:MAG: thermonuclease family protein [Armatimonadetes bacterium]|nr:thermonuclease family protein [Armatimonadota bacterium]
MPIFRFFRPLLAVVFAACFALASGAAWAQRTGDSFRGHVVAVTAGDTLDVRVSGSWTVTVRLHGAECPTTPRALRETATRYTSRLVLDTDVRVEVRGTASRSVVYGEVFPQNGGKSVNTRLVREGLATWAKEYAPTRADLQVAENAAKYAAHGMWGASDGSNVQLPASLADTLRRQARAKSAKTKPVASRAVKATPKPAVAAPLKTSVVAAPPSVPAESPLIPIAGGVGTFALTLLALFAHGVSRGLPFGAKRTGAQVSLAFLAGVCGAAAFALPVRGFQSAFAFGIPLAVFAAFALPLLAAALLRFGGAVAGQTARLRGEPVDPRTFNTPGFVKLHGIAKRLPGDLPCSDMGDVTGLYVRERTARFTAETNTGARAARPCWVAVRDSTLAAPFELFSSAGDGTGSAVVLCDQDEEQTVQNGSLRWIPYHVARFYNEMPTDKWFAAAYEGDTRTEVFFVPPNATLTVWGTLHAPDPSQTGRDGVPMPRLAPDAATGVLLLCDGAEARAYPKASGLIGTGALVVGLVSAAGAVYAVSVGGSVAVWCAVSALGLAGIVLLLATVGQGASLARAAGGETQSGETDLLRQPATVAWQDYRRTGWGAFIAGAVA